MKLRKEGFGAFLKMSCAKHGMVLATYNVGDRKTRLEDVVKLKAEGRLSQNPAEGCQLISALRATECVEGEIAEVGTSHGGSARLIGLYSNGKPIHVFDTFEGLPKPDSVDDARFFEGQYACSLENVRNYLQGLPVEFHQGVFPKSAAPVQDRRFSFVHLDVDLYRGTLDSLEFFYPRMNAGAILISHDYVIAEGVNRAFTEFFADKPEAPIELIGYQVMFVKLSQTHVAASL
jgi:hypothetical protein